MLTNADANIVLTKNLVRFQLKRTQVVPEFIDPENPALTGVVEQLLQVFKDSPGKTRSQLEEETKLIIDNAECSGVLARGFEKLLTDRLDFNTATNEELVEFRADLFSKTSTLLAEKPFASLEAYQTHVLEQTAETTIEGLSNRLYGDLPENQMVIAFRALSAERLLYRYNCALVQWLFLNSNELKISLHKPEARRIRQLFKHLRFHQLLALIQKEGDAYSLTIDGPLNLFYQTKKYGMSLANFFPALLHQPEWQLEATINLRNRKPKLLKLDQDSNLKPYSQGFSAFVPEEISLFQQLFAKKEDAWTLAPAEEFVALEGEHYCFPDFSLTHPATDTQTHLELFHPWHASHLTMRLEQLKDAKKPNLLIGVSRRLLKDPLVTEATESSAYFAQYGFLFRDMPTMDPVKKLLKKVLEAPKK